jgi:hypothetical protein
MPNYTTNALTTNTKIPEMTWNSRWNNHDAGSSGNLLDELWKQKEKRLECTQRETVDNELVAVETIWNQGINDLVPLVKLTCHQGTCVTRGYAGTTGKTVCVDELPYSEGVVQIRKDPWLIIKHRDIWSIRVFWHKYWSDFYAWGHVGKVLSRRVCCSWVPVVTRFGWIEKGSSVVGWAPKTYMRRDD